MRRLDDVVVDADDLRELHEPDASVRFVRTDQRTVCGQTIATASISMSTSGCHSVATPTNVLAVIG